LSACDLEKELVSNGRKARRERSPVLGRKLEAVSTLAPYSLNRAVRRVVNAISARWRDRTPSPFFVWMPPHLVIS
jgi:hypothetical protein